MGIFKKLFPNNELISIEGKIAKSGTSLVQGRENEGVQRWVQINEVIITRVNDGLYHSQWGDTARVVCDGNNNMIAYWNDTKDSGSGANYYSVIGAIALDIFFILFSMYGPFDIWNFIWKNEWFVQHWWYTVFVIALYGLYGFLWTPIFVFLEIKRQKLAQRMLDK
ncbi:MAG: hypothetical protein ACKO8Q_01520 [Bacteroidota bacterium]|jgi:hypothetical protein